MSDEKNKAGATHSMDSSVKLKCTNLDCGWSIIWHDYKEYFPKGNHVCEECGSRAVIKPIEKRSREICRLGVPYVVNKGRQTHYTKGGVL